VKNGVAVAGVVLVVASFAGMMRLKTDVEELVRERGQLARERLELRETKRVLEAEIAYLGSPDVLAAFAKTQGYVELEMTALVPLQPPSPTQPTVSATHALVP
jgi:cell division protein FtsB